MNNVRILVGLIVVSSPSAYPKYGGPNLVLYLVKSGELRGDGLSYLFCPGDDQESFKETGGPEAYADVDLKKTDGYGHLTSYAARDLLNRACVVEKASLESHVMVCDDSEDHHAGRGFVVGLNSGASKWREKVDDWLVDTDTTVEVGEGSKVEELRCLRAD